ncbi:MAG TPA: hypothetical protein VIM16_09990 [Mucilaginibacter sp.]|jgi:hypothetical protein
MKIKKIHINKGDSMIAYYSPHAVSYCGIKFNMYKAEYKRVIVGSRFATCKRCINIFGKLKDE